MSEIQKEDLIINLTIDGTEYENVEVEVIDPNRTIREQIENIVSKFALSTIAKSGLPIQYVLGRIKDKDEKPEILEFEDEDGRELALVDYSIHTGDSLYLVSCNTEDEELVINLTIDGTEYEDVEVKVTDPNKTICNQIKSIVSVFELPMDDQCGHPIQYLLGLTEEENEEPEILDFEDENGHELTLVNYNIQTGDRLHLISTPLYACPIPKEMETDYKRRLGKHVLLYACPIPPDMQNYWDELYKDL